jgi:hypothetical protein
VQHELAVGVEADVARGGREVARVADAAGLGVVVGRRAVLARRDGVVMLLLLRLLFLPPLPLLLLMLLFLFFLVPLVLPVLYTVLKFVACNSARHGAKNGWTGQNKGYSK